MWARDNIRLPPYEVERIHHSAVGRSSCGTRHSASVERRASSSSSSRPKQARRQRAILLCWDPSAHPVSYVGRTRPSAPEPTRRPPRTPVSITGLRYPRRRCSPRPPAPAGTGWRDPAAPRCHVKAAPESFGVRGRGPRWSSPRPSRMRKPWSSRTFLSSSAAARSVLRDRICRVPADTSSSHGTAGAR
ncbi:hypothetical protein [Streptomyces olivaceoviridis]|uniref:hypothetical protein n=1 Tax=Streptomyces olivaceoviridis TaxID=1921 RepID=UPI0036841F3E